MRTFVLILLTMAVALATPAAQSRAAYKARLSPLGVTGATVTTITGVGAVTATLDGTKLTIDGTFEGLTGNATAAHLHRAPKAMPGPRLYDLEFTKAPKGRVNGVITLTPEQVADLNAGNLYVQIHSERAPEGSIRGWLLK